MGLSLGMGRDKYGEDCEKVVFSKYDPNTSKFSILHYLENCGNTVVFVNYPNCKNYEGNKIIVYRGVSFDQIKKLTEIDPHFTSQGDIRPFARFEPTQEGWNQAVALTYVTHNLAQHLTIIPPLDSYPSKHRKRYDAL